MTTWVNNICKYQSFDPEKLCQCRSKLPNSSVIANTGLCGPTTFFPFLAPQQLYHSWFSQCAMGKRLEERVGYTDLLFLPSKSPTALGHLPSIRVSHDVQNHFQAIWQQIRPCEQFRTRRSFKLLSLRNLRAELLESKKGTH